MLYIFFILKEQANYGIRLKQKKTFNKVKAIDILEILLPTCPQVP